MTDTRTLAEAIIMGTIPAESVSDAMETLRQANAERERSNAAEALTAYRTGEPVWSWPAVAPWAGFGSAL